jgi:hypothetical protein
MCRTGSHAIKLQGDQFEFAGPQQESLLIAKKDAPVGLAGLMERFAGGTLLTVGLGRAAGRQIRQFHVDAKALFEHAEFQKRLDYVVRRSLPASLRHVIAVDEASLPFAEHIAAAVSPPAVVLGRGSRYCPQRCQHRDCDCGYSH